MRCRRCPQRVLQSPRRPSQVRASGRSCRLTTPSRRPSPFLHQRLGCWIEWGIPNGAKAAGSRGSMHGHGNARCRAERSLLFLSSESILLALGWGDSSLPFMLHGAFLGLLQTWYFRLCSARCLGFQYPPSPLPDEVGPNPGPTAKPATP